MNRLSADAVVRVTYPTAPAALCPTELVKVRAKHAVQTKLCFGGAKGAMGKPPAPVVALPPGVCRAIDRVGGKLQLPPCTASEGH